MRRIAGHHIHMVQQNNRPFPLGCCMWNSRPKIAAPRRVLEHPILNPFLIKNLLVERHRPHFIPRRIRRVDAQVLLHPRHCQVGILS